MVNLVAPEGRVVAVPAEQVQAHLDAGFRPEGGAGAAQRVVGDVREERYGGALGKATAGALGVARTVTLGGSDVLANLTGDDDAVAAYREVNPGASLVGEIAGAFVPVGAGAAAGRLGARIAKTGEGAGAVTRAVRAGAGYGAEGAIMGAGQGVSELALSDDPLSIERVASVMSSNVLFGGATGGAVGMGGSAVGSVLRKAKGALDEFASAATAAGSDDVARKAFADDLAAFRQQTKDEKVFLATKGAKTWEGVDDALKKEMSEIGKVSLEADRAMDRMLRNPKALASRPQRALDSLQQQEHALEKLVSRREDLARVFAADTSGARAAALDSAEKALARNREMQARIADLTATPAAATGKSMGEQMAGGAAYSLGSSLASAVPVIGPFLAPFAGAKAAQVVGDGLGKAAKQQAQRMADGIGMFLNVGGKVAPAAPVLATKVLGALAFGSEKATDASLASLYRARSTEIQKQVATGPDGRAMMRPDARQKMAAQLAPVRAADPLTADRIETQAARRLAFLADNLPRRPDLGALETGPDRWQPSDLAMRSWARLAAAAEDPAGIVERMASGAVTPEDAKVMRELYPEMLAEMTQQILEQLPTLQKQLPYHRRLALSIMTGVPVDPAMNPRILRVLQGAFASEPGTEGGTQAPRAQAAFGSVRAAPGTLSQRREQGVTS